MLPQIIAQLTLFLTETAVLPEAVQLGIHFLDTKNCNAAYPRGTCLRTHY